MDKLLLPELEKKLSEARGRSVGTRWRHYKGATYVISDVAIMEASGEIAVIYTPLDFPTVSFVRPLTVWAELVQWQERSVPRFTKIDP